MSTLTDNLADTHGVTVAYLRNQIITAGYDPDTGHPAVKPTKEPLLDVFAGLWEADWMNDALCAQTDPESFYPEKGHSTRDAKATCMRCDVRAECLEDALVNRERWGIWGGVTERERRKMIHARDARMDVAS